MVFKNYAGFDGRASRSEYWYFFLFNLIFSVVFLCLDMMLGTIDYELGIGVLGSIYALVLFVPSIAALTRRLHDTGRSGWFWLIALIPIIGPIILIVFLAQDSALDANQYGANPKKQ